MFKIDPSRRTAVLIEVGDAAFEGVLGWDSFSASCRYPREFGGVWQFGLGPLIREGKFQRTVPEAWDRASGERWREALRRLLGVIQRPEGWSAATWQSRGGAAWVAVWRCGLQEAPETRPRRPLAKRGETPGASCFRFLRTPGVEPTHTLAEPAIRLVGRDGVVRPGTRSEVGKRWGERLWTAIARCTQQGQTVFASVPSAVEGWFAGTEAPALFPEG